MSDATCDLYDEHGDAARVVDLQMTDYGARRRFHGTAVTALCFEDNGVVKQLAGQPGVGKVMVVDGGASLRCALLGDMIAREAMDNGWEGIIIRGAVRDRAELATMDIGVKALGTTPRKSVRRDQGVVWVTVEIGGVAVQPGDRIFADEDGVLVLGA